MGHNSRSHHWSSVVLLGAFVTAIGLPGEGPVAFAADVRIFEVQAAAANGIVSKEVELAGDYFVGRGVPRDATMAAYWYEKAAERGDPEAQKDRKSVV